MALKNPFRGFRFLSEVIVWAVRWYLRFAVGLRDLEEMLAERGVPVDHLSLHRWVQRFAPGIERRLRPHLRSPDRTRHVDETYARVGGGRLYLCRAVDGAGRTVEFLLSAARDAAAARRLFLRAPGRRRACAPRLVVTGRLACCRTALAGLKRDGRLPDATRHLRGRRFNNRVEQVHRRIKRRTRPMPGFKRFATARRALAGTEAVAMLAEGQVRRARAWVTRPRSATSSTGAPVSPPERGAEGRRLTQRKSTQQNPHRRLRLGRPGRGAGNPRRTPPAQGRARCRAPGRLSSPFVPLCYKSAPSVRSGPSVLGHSSRHLRLGGGDRQPHVGYRKRPGPVKRRQPLDRSRQSWVATEDTERCAAR